MQNNKPDNALAALTSKIKGLPPLLSECCIFRVYPHLREVNEKAYEPELVSIGPYHRGKDKLQMMEEHKLRYLQGVLLRKKEDLRRYVFAMTSIEEKARKCYADRPVNIDKDEFVQMLILDSCFIVEVMGKYDEMGRHDEKHDIIFKMNWMIASLRRDLMLFENQLPYFVIRQMFDLIHQNMNNPVNLKYLVGRFFWDFLNKSDAPQENSKTTHSCNLIVRDQALMRMSDSHIMHLLEHIHESALPSRKASYSAAAQGKEFLYMPCASKLVEAGVKFKKLKEGNLFDITFNPKDGVLSIPPLRIEDRTESIFRNLIAFEQYSDPNSYKFVSEYAAFMDRLINTPKDVEILSSKGIVDNWLGEDEVISNIFNKIVLVVVSSKCFQYADVCTQVNLYCNRPMNRWMAKLKRNYLHSPWGIISVVAATILLLLTLTQTVATLVFK